MKIEEGKYYRTRDGQKVGPMRRSNCRDYQWTAFFNNDNRLWDAFGRRYMESYGSTDLIAEWTDDSPVRVVTRKEIVPGVYDLVKVMKNGTNNRPGIIIDDFMNSDQLRKAAAILNEIADALEDE